MATNFDLLRRSSLFPSGGGGLLGLGDRPLTPEEEEELLRQQMLAANDPLAPLPDVRPEEPVATEDKPFLPPVEEDKPLVDPLAPLPDDELLPVEAVATNTKGKKRPAQETVVEDKPLIAPEEEEPSLFMPLEGVMQEIGKRGELPENLRAAGIARTNTAYQRAVAAQEEADKVVDAERIDVASPLRSKFDSQVAGYIAGAWKEHQGDPTKVAAFTKKLAESYGTNWGYTPESMKETLEFIKDNPRSLEAGISFKGQKLTPDQLAQAKEELAAATTDGQIDVQRLTRPYTDQPVEALVEGLRGTATATVGGMISSAPEAMIQSVERLTGNPSLGAAIRDGIEPVAKNIRLAGRALGAGGEAWRERANPGYKEGTNEYYAFQTVTAFAELGAAFSAASATKSPNVGAAIIAARVFGEQNNDSLERGRTPQQAFVDGTAMAVAEFLPERMVVKQLLGTTGSKALDIVKGMGGESLQEITTEIITMGYEAGIFGDDVTVKQALQRMFDAGIIGAGAGGGVAATTGGARSAAETKTAVALRDRIATWANQRLAMGAINDGDINATSEQVANAFNPSRVAGGVVQQSGVSMDELRKSKLPAVPRVLEGERPYRPVLVKPTPEPVNRDGQPEKFALPKGRVTSKFGPRQTFRTANGQMASSNHAGVDIGLPSGAAAPAGASGVVVAAGPRGGYGNQVVIQHADGTTSSYSHLSRIGVKVGQEIAQGQSVGKVGKTGNATGPHLHIERRDRQGRAVNPETGAIVATSRNAETKEWEDDTEYTEDQTEVDNFYDDMIDQQELDDTYTEATGQQWDPQDFEPTESEEVEPAVARGDAQPAQAETPAPRTGAALDALESEEVPEPTRVQENVSTRLTEAKDRNPAAQAMAEERRSGGGNRLFDIQEEADYSQPLPNEETIFGSDDSGVGTGEVVGFINTQTKQSRAIGEPPAADVTLPPSTAEPTQEVQPTTPASAPIETTVPETQEFGGLSVEDRTSLYEALPAPPQTASEDVKMGRGDGQAVALGLAEPQDLSAKPKAYVTAYNVGLQEGSKALASAAGESFVSTAGPALATTQEIPEGSAEIISEPAAPTTPVDGLSVDGAAPSGIAEFMDQQATALDAAPVPVSNDRRMEVAATVEKIEDKMFDFETDDAPKSKVKAYLKGLVKKGVMEQADLDAMDYLFKDRDMGVEDITSEVRGALEMWAERELGGAAPVARDRRTSGPTKIEDAVPGYAKVAKHLTPEERARVKRSAAQKLVALWDKLPTPTEMAAVAISARDARGWYEASAKALVEVFGHKDATRFAALLAATSPQNSVRLNLYNALKIWTGWNRAGRPTDRKSIVKIMGDNVAGDKGLGSVLNAWINNTVTALSDPVEQLVLSGPKVNSFFHNLIGEVDEVTNDAWMAAFAGVDPTFIKGTTVGKRKATKSVGYMAYAARVRKAAEVASKRTGDNWTPAEIQETVWSWAKTVYEMRDKAGENRTVQQLLDAGAVTTADIANTEDFAVLFTNNLFANILGEAGYGQPSGIRQRGGADASVAGGVRSVTDAEGTGFTERDFTRNLQRAGGRLERVRQERRGGKLSERRKQEGAGSQQAEARGLPERGPVSRSEEPVAIDSRKKLGFDKPLPGQPQAVEVPGYGKVAFGPLPVAQQAARDYMASIGQTYTPTKVAPSVNVERATRIATAFDTLEHNPQDPDVQAAYKAMVDETIAQWKAIEATGLKVEFIDFAKTGDPYAATPRLMQIDVAENNHMWVFKTDDGFGSDETIDVSDNPLLALTDIYIGGHQLRANDVFRIVHDYFGHVKDGHGFRAKGEEGAWQAHSQMYSPLARRAMTTETRGQNSWVNYGPNGETNRDANSAETVYAPQKVGLLPQWAVEEGALQAPAFRERVEDGTEQRTERGGREADDQDGQGSPELERPPVNEDGTVTLQHYTTAEGLTETDPTLWGQTKIAFTREERAYMMQAPPRTYFGIATGQPGGYKQEFQGRTEVEARLPMDRLYDVGADPDNLWVQGKAHIGERNIKDAGHAGYWHKNPELGLVAVVFEPVQVKATAKAKDKRQTAYERIGSKRAFRADILQTVLDELGRMGIAEGRSDLKLSVISDFGGRTYDGRYYYPQTWDDHPLIEIVALSHKGARITARHEAIHWMRDQGIISRTEWPYLAKWAKNNANLMAWAKANYPSKDGFTLEDQIEEAVAEGFARWNGGDPALVTAKDSIVATVFARIREIIRSIREAFGAAGITRGELNEAARLMAAIRGGDQVRKYDAAKQPSGFGRRSPYLSSISRDMLAGRITPEQAQMLRNNPKPKDQAGWHGTKAEDIDKFSLDFMGTGEGAQAFGWGLYFAQKQAVADWYRRKLTMNQNLPTVRAVKVGGQPLSEWIMDRFGSGHGTAAVEVADRVFEYLTTNQPYNGWLDALQVQFEKDMVEYMADAEANEDAAEIEALANEAQKVEMIFDNLRMKKVELDTGATKGALYKVEVPENEDLLDLDAPLSNQSPKITKALEAIEAEVNIEDYTEMDFWDLTGQELQNVLKVAVYQDALPITGDAMETAVENGEAPKAVSLYLRDKGVVGSRYLDRDSRGQPENEATRNFVIFDDGVVEIRAKTVTGRGYRDRVVRAPQAGPLSDPTKPNPGIFRRIHDQTMSFLTMLGSAHGKGDWDAADSFIDAFRRKVTQRYQQVIKTQQRVAAEQGLDRLPPEQNVMENITADERGYKLQHLTDNMIRPMAEEMQARGVSMDDLGLYLYARHAPARNARIAAINPEFRAPDKPGSGMTNVDAANIMAQFVAEGKDADLAAVAVYIDRMIEMAQQERLQSGLLTQDALDAGFQPQDHYVPLRGNENIEPEMEMTFPISSRKGGGFSVAGGEGHRMYGRESRANLEEIVGYTITQAQEAIDRSYRNKVDTVMLNMFRAVPDPNFVSIDRVKRVPVWNKAKGQVEYQMQTRMNDPLEQQRTIFVKDGDTIHKMTFNDRNPSAMRFVKAAKNLGVQELNRGLQLMSVFTRLWSKSNTQWNVDFILANATKDIQTGVLNASTLNTKGLRRAMIKNIASLKPLMASLMGSMNKAGAGATSTNPWFQTYAEFEANGGKLNYGQITPLEDAIREAKAEMKNAGRSNANPIKWAKATFSFIDHVNSGFENMTRLAAYKALRDGGVPAKQAAEAVRELTTNFQQHGEWGPKVNAAYGFANASIIGGARFMKTVATNPMVLTGLVLTGMLEDFLNSMLDDDDWDQYTEEDKHANFILMLPESFGFDLKIPAGYGLNAFITTGRKMSELWRGKKNKDGTELSLLEASADVAMGFINAFSPITGQSFWNIVSPTVLDPIVNIYRNENNWGKPIMPPQAFRKEQEKPDSQLAFDNTHQFWKTVAEGMNALGGGSKVEPGFTPLDVSPESIKHVTSETVGGMGRTFMRTLSLAGKLAKGEDVGPNDIPIVRRFAGLPFGAASAKDEQTGAFYDRINEARKVVARAKATILEYGKDSPEYAKFRKENERVIEFADSQKKAEKRLLAINTAENAAERFGSKGGWTRSKQAVQRDRNALVKMGFIIKKGEVLTPEQVAKVKQRAKERKATLAEEYNAAYLEKVMGDQPES